MKFAKIILLVLVLFFDSYAQVKNLKFDFDYSMFKSNDSLTHLEFYYSFYQPDMGKIYRENSIFTIGRLNVKINNQKTGDFIDAKGGRFESRFDSTADKLLLVGKLDFLLPQGKYNMLISAFDEIDTTSKYSSQLIVEVKNYSSDRLEISDIQLANQIVSSTDENSIFYKNTLDVEPNPTKVFSYQYPVMFFYAEYYNVKNDMTAEYILKNSNSKVMYDKSKKIAKNKNSIVDAGSINIKDFPSGIYTLQITLNNKINSAEKNKKFFIYNPDKLDTNIAPQKNIEDILQNEYIGLSEEELNLIFRKSEYAATENERKEWKKLSNAEGKQNYLKKFWESKDENPVTPVNETKIAYFERVDYAQQKYSGLSQKEGWRTDRGRVYITYGKPSEIERYPNESELKPYEIWHYDSIEGGVIFIFADLTGYSDYRLIHSTKRGEFSSPDWQKEIR